MKQLANACQENSDEKKEGETAETSTDAPVTTEAVEAPTNEAEATTEVQPLRDITNQINTDNGKKTSKNQNRPQRERRERGPPADGIPSKTKVMVANLPYDLTEEKVSLDVTCFGLTSTGMSSN